MHLKPSSHSSQYVALTDPASLENFPFGHGVHCVDFDNEYEPDGQMDSLVEVQEYPARHGVQEEAPASEYVPSSQGVQDVDLAFELDPAEHIVTLVKVQLDPGGQSMHEKEAPYEYDPSLQAVLTPPRQA